eukprot:COSAG01_NODE_39015_length_482_cov_0.673629_1_plen_40_part_10
MRGRLLSRVLSAIDRVTLNLASTVVCDSLWSWLYSCRNAF